ncbi:MAG: diguanylate cyclase [Gammaproteobacteria bacterium]|nr:diguanylate cyclase [Gammaproteobacteria bacterium]
MINLKQSLSTLLPAMRISLALVLLTSCILLSAEFFGYAPKEEKFLLEARTKISESLALQISILITDQDIKQIQKLIRLIIKRRPDVLSAGIRLASGQLMFASANHTELWGDAGRLKSSISTHVLIPIIQRGTLWGNIEIRYKDIDRQTFAGFFQRPIFKLIVFISLIGFFAYLVFMLRTLRVLDPTAAIPDRVNTAFDTLAEGVLIIDEDDYILLANKAFSSRIKKSAQSLLGQKASSLPWRKSSDGGAIKRLPWKAVIETGKDSVGVSLDYRLSKKETIKFAANAAPILDGDNKSQGVLVTLDDISDLEQRNTNLKGVVENLQKAQFQVKQQNKELNFLATRDPLTSCLNRRSFSAQFETLFADAHDSEHALACVMVDIDHFKAVNDNYGHATGDEIIKMLAEILKSNTRSEDLVARYGGEEFCLVLPGMSDDVALKTSERIRLKIKDESTRRYKDGPHITASLGIASLNDKPASPEDLNKLADEALYVAKETGRNRVIRWASESGTLSDRTELQTEADTDDSEADSTSQKTIKQLQDHIQHLEEMALHASEQLKYSQNYDELTGLPNRILFHDRINQAIERGYRQNQLAAVLVIDSDMFKQVSDNLGTTVGSQLLHTFADRLTNIFRRSDGITRLTLSRLDSNEFAVLLSDVSEQEQVTWVIKRLFDDTEIPIEVDEHSFYLKIRVGVSIYPTDANSVDELMSHSTTAKKFCKDSASGSSYLFFDKNMQTNSMKYLHLEKELRNAIKHDQWLLQFQPKLDIIEKRIVGAEALVRWQHPKKGLLLPADFIDFAERHGLIVPIGNWVIQQTCIQLRNLILAGVTNCKIAINLSSVQLIQPDIVENICSQLEKYDIPPRLLEIEVTETSLIDNMEVASKSLKRLNTRGIPISIDDFGTGYSSLSYLKKLPLNCLKIDRSFIKDICNDESDRQIVKTLISMAHSLGLKVIAEGVEEQQQLELLDEFYCDEIQGYLLSEPINSDELVKIFKNPQSYQTITDNIVELHSAK